VGRNQSLEIRGLDVAAVPSGLSPTPLIIIIIIIIIIIVGSAIFHEHEFWCKPKDGAVIGERVPPVCVCVCVY
jgi:hypothetical protein